MIMSKVSWLDMSSNKTRVPEQRQTEANKHKLHVSFILLFSCKQCSERVAPQSTNHRSKSERSELHSDPWRESTTIATPRSSSTATAPSTSPASTLSSKPPASPLAASPTPSSPSWVLKAAVRCAFVPEWTCSCSQWIGDFNHRFRACSEVLLLEFRDSTASRFRFSWSE